MKTVIYAADDDENIRNLMQIFLENEGYSVVTFSTGDLLFEQFLVSPCDLVILDIMMPGSDGFKICSELRQLSNVPIIMLTAKDTDTDYIAGITLGSDDYITKPFRPTMLTIRVKALLRRIAIEKEQVISSQGKEEISYRDLTYSYKKHAVFCKGKNLNFTETELKYFQVLMENQEDAVSKLDLLDRVWGNHADIETRVTDETTRRIRKKIKLAGSIVVIRTIWGYGYRLDALEENR